METSQKNAYSTLRVTADVVRIAGLNTGRYAVSGWKRDNAKAVDVN